LTEKGASFFAEMVRSVGLLPSQVETALGELVAAGLVTSDSFTGLRALLTPNNLRTQTRRKRQAVYQIALAGRWSLLDRDFALSASNSSPEANKSEMLARVLLRRYGVVFKRLLVGEDLPLPWREIVKVFYRLEARGEIRGGRFVGGFSGEQFALPEAVGMLRTIRRTTTDALVSISAADPLNLVGVLTPGNRLAALTDNRVLFQGGLPIAIRESGKHQFLVSLSPASQWEAKTALIRRNIPAQLRTYLRRPAS
jgi:ATP-dependent Lhr-like helicase